MTGRELQNKWVEKLQHQYDEREAKELLRLYLEDVHRVSRLSWLSMLDAPVSFNYESDLSRLVHGEPIQHVIGFAVFMGRPFEVNPDVLIPRPETEDLVNWVCEHAPQNSRVLDIGTGSGCIAISMAAERNDFKVSAVDVSSSALKVARTNAEALGSKVEFAELDILASSPGSAYDVWVSNPPYIEEQERSEMDSHVVDYDPDLALFVPDGDPLLFYRRIAELALSEGISLTAFECHINFAKEVADMMRNLGFSKVELVADFTERERIVIGRL